MNVKDRFISPLAPQRGGGGGGGGGQGEDAGGGKEEVGEGEVERAGEEGGAGKRRG